MKLASHNTFTYLKPRQWWLRPFHFMARCQSETVLTQYNCGARIFDMRIAFDSRHRPRFAHGLMTFGADVYDTLAGLDALSTPEDPIQVRVLKERAYNDDRDFALFCEYIRHRFSGIQFAGGQEKSTWRRVYDFGRDIRVYDSYASWNHDRGHWGTGSILDDLCPAFYARRRNARVLADYRGDLPLMLDFIGKYGW